MPTNFCQLMSTVRALNISDTLLKEADPLIRDKVLLLRSRLESFFNEHVGRMFLVIFLTSLIGRISTSSITQERAEKVHSDTSGATASAEAAPEALESTKKRIDVNEPSKAEDVSRQLMSSNIERSTPFFLGRFNVKSLREHVMTVHFKSSVFKAHAFRPGDTIRFALENPTVPDLSPTSLPPTIQVKTLSSTWQQHLIKQGVNAPEIAVETLMKYVDLAKFDGTLGSCIPLVRFFSVIRAHDDTVKLTISVNEGGYTQLIQQGRIQESRFDISRSTLFRVPEGTTRPLLFGAGTGANALSLFAEKYQEARLFTSYKTHNEDPFRADARNNAVYTQQGQSRLPDYLLKDIDPATAQEIVQRMVSGEGIIICGSVGFVTAIKLTLFQLFSQNKAFWGKSVPATLENEKDIKTYFDTHILKNIRTEAFSGPSTKSELPVLKLDQLMANGRLWVRSGDVVYDLEDYSKVHPGGDVLLKLFYGQDITRLFKGLSVHDKGAESELRSYGIGRLDRDELERANAEAPYHRAYQVFTYEVEQVVEGEGYELLRAAMAFDRWELSITNIDPGALTGIPKKLPVFPYERDMYGNFLPGQEIEAAAIQAYIVSTIEFVNLFSILCLKGLPVKPHVSRL